MIYYNVLYYTIPCYTLLYYVILSYSIEYNNHGPCSYETTRGISLSLYLHVYIYIYIHITPTQYYSICYYITLYYDTLCLIISYQCGFPDARMDASQNMDKFAGFADRAPGGSLYYIYIYIYICNSLSLSIYIYIYIQMYINK